MKTKKKVIKLTESDLHNIIKNTVKKMIIETDEKNPSITFDKVYQMIIDCNDAIRGFYFNSYSFDNSEDARACKRILSIADSLHVAAHEFQEHLVWDE